jgi:branched-chain amino acid transport system permease protein
MTAPREGSLPIVPAARRAMTLRPYHALLGALLAAAAATPVIGRAYHVTLMFLLLLHVAMAATYDIVGGYTGYVNLGHGAFFGLGAYVYGATIAWGGHPVLGLVLAVGAAGGFGALAGPPLFRLRGVYFAIGTFGLLKVFEVLAVNCDALTGGTPGLSIPPSSTTTGSYYVMLGAAVAALALNGWVARSRMGLGLVSIREDEDVAEGSGIPSRRLKRDAFVLSALVPGLVGAVYMWQLAYINPTTAFGFEMSFPPVIMALLGGTGTLAGPLVGAVFLTLLEEVLWSRLGYLQLAMYGLVLLLVGTLMPGGLMRSAPFRRVYRVLGLPDHYGYHPA